MSHMTNFDSDPMLSVISMENFEIGKKTKGSTLGTRSKTVEAINDQ